MFSPAWQAYGSLCLARLNLLLAVLRRRRRDKFWHCLALSFCAGVFIEYAYPLLQPAHLGGCWIDIGVYVAGGLSAACLYAR